MQTVKIVRADHPDGAVTINKCDMKDGDVIAGQEPPVKPKRGRPAKSKPE